MEKSVATRYSHYNTKSTQFAYATSNTSQRSATKTALQRIVATVCTEAVLPNTISIQLKCAFSRTSRNCFLLNVKTVSITLQYQLILLDLFACVQIYLGSSQRMIAQDYELALTCREDDNHGASLCLRQQESSRTRSCAMRRCVARLSSLEMLRLTHETKDC
jgi:hypothetical protein